MYDHLRQDLAGTEQTSVEIRSKNLSHLVFTQSADLDVKVEFFSKGYSGVLVERMNTVKLASFSHHEQGYDSGSVCLNLGHITLIGQDALKVTFYNTHATNSVTVQLTSFEKKVTRDFVHKYGITTMQSNNLNDVNAVVFDYEGLSDKNALTYDLKINDNYSVISAYALADIQKLLNDKLSNDDLASINTDTVLYDETYGANDFFYECKGAENPTVIYRQVIVSMERIKETEKVYNERIEKEVKRRFQVVDHKGGGQVNDARFTADPRRFA